MRRLGIACGAILVCAAALVAASWLSGRRTAAADEPAAKQNAAKQEIAKQNSADQDKDNTTQSDSPVAEFALQDFRGKKHRLSDFSDRKVVVLAFLGTECPLAKLYGPRLVELCEAYAERGVEFIGVNSNQQDSLTELAAYARRHEISFPLLKDPGNRVADQVGAERTPEVFVLDAERRVRYRGRIDDQFGVGYARDRADQHDLRAALDAVLAGKPVARPHQPAVGCLIGRVARPQAGSSVTYSNQIARLFQKHCVECHRSGEIAPFSLTNYDEVAGWAPTIAEVIEDQRMPPWHANPKHGTFANARGMTKQEKQLVYDWVDAGAPEGDPDQLPEPVKFVSGWRLPQKPEAVFSLPKPEKIPADGVVDYRYVVVDPKFEEDRWVSAAEVIPGNRAVVHHVIVFVRAPDASDFRGRGWLTAYVPGQSTMILKPGQAKRVPAGSKFVLQLHYTPIGSPQEDQTKVGLIFADPKSVKEEVMTKLAANRGLRIPPQAANHQERATARQFPKGSRLLAIAPHMHLRGKAFRVISHNGETSTTLLDVPHYDFNWQHAYALAKPLPLDRPLWIECIGTYDNSEDNLVNPNPSKTVRWGDQTWEEMMLAYFEIAVPVDPAALAAGKAQLDADQQAKVRKQADEFLKRFDKNKDGVVTQSELPKAIALFAMRRFDRNRDKKLDDQELLEAARQILRDRRRAF